MSNGLSAPDLQTKTNFCRWRSVRTFRHMGWDAIRLEAIDMRGKRPLPLGERMCHKNCCSIWRLLSVDPPKWPAFLASGTKVPSIRGLWHLDFSWFILCIEKTLRNFEYRILELNYNHCAFCSSSWQKCSQAKSQACCKCRSGRSALSDSRAADEPKTAINLAAAPT